MQVIQPFTSVLFNSFPHITEKKICHCTIYDVHNKQDIDKLHIIPAPGCVIIIPYGVSSSSIISVTSSTSPSDISLSSFSQFILVVSESDIVLKYSSKISYILSKCDSSKERISAVSDYISSCESKHQFKSKAAEIYNIIADCYGAISIEEIAEIKDYSVRHVCRLFKNEYGYAPKSFCRIMRFQRVLYEIFKDSNQPVSSFMQYSDYSDQAHFQREFKLFMSMTPLQFIQFMNKHS